MRLLATSQHDFPVVDASGAIAGVLLRNDLIAALRKDDPALRVGDIMRRDVPTVTTGTPFDEAFRVMQESNCPARAGGRSHAAARRFAHAGERERADDDAFGDAAAADAAHACSASRA